MTLDGFIRGLGHTEGEDRDGWAAPSGDRIEQATQRVDVLLWSGVSLMRDQEGNGLEIVEG